MMQSVDAAYVQSVRISLEAIRSVAHQHWIRVDAFYAGENVLDDLGPLIKPLRSSTAKAKVDAMFNSLVTRKPVVTRVAKRKGSPHEDNADLVEKWCTALLKQNDRRAAMPPFKMLSKHLTLYGYGVGKTLFNWAEWPDKPKGRMSKRLQEAIEDWKAKRAAAVPFLLTAPHPTMVLLPPTGKQPDMAVEVMEQYAYQCQQDYPEWDSFNDPFELVEKVLFWDNEHRLVLVKGEEVVNTGNDWGFVPYVQGFGGFGQIRGQRTQDKSMGFEDMAQGIISGVLELLHAESQELSAKHFLAMQMAQRVVYTPEDPKTLAQARAAATPAGFVKLRTEAINAMKWEELPNMQPWIDRHEDVLKGLIDQGTFVGEVAGERTQGVATAYQHAMILGRARLAFDVAMMQLNSMAAIQLGQCLRMVDTIGEPVTVGGITIGPGQIEKDFVVDVDFEEGDEQARRTLFDEGLKAVGAGKISDQTFLQEYAAIPNATEELDRIIVEKMIASQEIQGMILSEVQRRWQEKATGGVAPSPAGAVLPPPSPGGPLPGGLPTTPVEQFAVPGSPEEQAMMMRQQAAGIPMPPGIQNGGGQV